MHNLRAISKNVNKTTQSKETVFKLSYAESLVEKRKAAVLRRITQVIGKLYKAAP